MLFLIFVIHIFLSPSADKYIKFLDIRMNLVNNNNSNVKIFHSEKTKNGIKHITFNNSGIQFAYLSRVCLYMIYLILNK